MIEQGRARLARPNHRRDDDESMGVSHAKEEYGEADRPHPKQVVGEIIEKFVDWDVYKMSVLQDKMKEQAKRYSFAKSLQK